MKRHSTPFLFLFVLLFNTLTFANVWTDGYGPNHDWSEPYNWDYGVPTSSDDVFVPYIAGGSGAIINTGTSAVCNVFRGPGSGSSSSMAECTMNGGTLTTVALKIAYDTGTKGTFYMNGGDLIIENRLQPGFKSEGYFIMEGGYVSSGQGLRIGSKAGGDGHAIINDGSMDLAKILIGENADSQGYMEVNGGTIDSASGSIEIPSALESQGHLQVNGGTLKSGSMVISDGGSADITGGEIILTGDKVSEAENLVVDGYLTAHDGQGDVLIDYDGTNTVITASEVNLSPAWNPNPENVSEINLYDNQPLWLVWSPGQDVVEHRLYAGHNYTDVNNAGTSSDLLLATLSSDVNEYQYGSDIYLGQEFYWRVDEVNSFSGVTKGDIWSFKIRPFENIDNFDDYEAYSDLTANGWSTTDSFDLQLSGYLYIFDKVSLKFDFNNTAYPYNSELTKAFNQPLDWNNYGIKSLSFSYFGDTSVKNLYLKLSDGTASDIVECSDLMKLQADVWSKVDFDLSDFGIDLSNVSSLTIGLGDPQSTEAGGSGTVYIDDIKIYTSRCMPSYGRADVDRDCMVEYPELGAISENWLLSNYEVSSQAPGSTNLKVHYNFNEASGDIIYDQTANNYHGTLDSNGLDSRISSDGYSNSAYLNFDGTYGISIPSSIFNDLNDGLTISLWLRAETSGDKDMNFFAGLSDYQIDGSQNDFIRSDFTADHSQWYHFALVKNSENQTLDIYRDGLLVARNRKAVMTLQENNSGTTRIGLPDASGLDSYVGDLDEMKIYDKPLAHAEILYLAQGAGANLLQPLLPAVTDFDPVSDGKVNLIDFNYLADIWLEKELWP